MSVSSGDEWEMISNSLIKDQDEAADFLARPGFPGEEVSAELQAKMTDLQDTINRLSMLGIRGATMTQDDAMEIEEEPVADPM
jgi:hypothetical protein